MEMGTREINGMTADTVTGDAPVQEESLDTLTRSLPGILRLDSVNHHTWDLPTDGNGTHGGDVTREHTMTGLYVADRPDKARSTEHNIPGLPAADRTRGMSENHTPELLAADRPDRVRAKKRVSFQAEEHLERIMEISPRAEYPLIEELEPCDPERLLQGHDMDVYGDSYNSGYVLSGPIPGRRTANVMARVSGMLGFGVPSSVAPPLSNIARNHTVLMDPRSSHNRQTAATSTARRRIHSAPVTKSPQIYNQRSNNNNNSNTESPMEQRINRNNAHRGMYARSKSAPSRDRTQMSGNYIQHHRTYHSKHDLITPDINLNRTRASQLRINGTQVQSRTQLHQSPYRQGAPPAGRTLGTIRPETGMMSTLSVTGARMEAHGNMAERRTLVAPSVSPRKVHAWQAADSAMKTNNLTVSEPCIAQLWNSPRTTIDTLYSS